MGGRHPPQWSKQRWTGRFELHTPSPPTPPLPSNRKGKKCIPQLLALRAPESPHLVPPHYLPPLGIPVQPHKPSFPDPECGLLKPLPLVMLRYWSAPGLATRYMSSGLWCQALPVSINVHPPACPDQTISYCHCPFLPSRSRTGCLYRPSQETGEAPRPCPPGIWGQPGCKPTRAPAPQRRGGTGNPRRAFMEETGCLGLARSTWGGGWDGAGRERTPGEQAPARMVRAREGGAWGPP